MTKAAVAPGVAGTVTVLWRYVTFSGLSNDHYVHVARGYEMLRGAWPVRDFVDPGMPLTYVLSAVGRVLFDNRILAEFLVVAGGFGVGAAATAWAVVRLTGSATLAAIAVAMQVLVSPRTYSYPKMLVYGLACAMVVSLAGAAPRRRLVLAGVLIAAAFLIRHDHGLYLAAAFSITVLVGAAGLAQGAGRVATMGTAAALCVLPWAVAVQLWGGLLPYFRAGVAFSRREAEVSLLREWPRFDLAGAGVSIGNASSWLYYAAYLLPVLCLLLVWRRTRTGVAAPGEAAAIAGVAVLALATARGFLRDPLDGRVQDVMVPLGVLTAWTLQIGWRRPSRTWAAAAASAVWLLVTTAAIWRVGAVRSHLDDAGLLDDWGAVTSNVADVTAELTQRQRDVVRTPTRVTAALVPFFQYVERCTEPADRLLVTGAYADVFIAADRGFAGGMVSYQQGFYAAPADQALALERMRAERVPFALRIRTADAVFTRDFPSVAAFVERSYVPFAEVAVPDDDAVDIRVRRDLAAVRTDAGTGWPCFK